MTRSTLSRLADAPGAVVPDPPDEVLPMQKVTRQVAFEGGWSPGRARRIEELFDEMADEWHSSHVGAERLAPLIDALERGGIGGGRWLELGAGTGVGTRELAPLVDELTAVDLSMAMLRNGWEERPRVQADAVSLPFGDDCFDGVLLVNMLLFPDEVDRVLAPGAQLVWVNTAGERTPIHLLPEQVLAAMPGQWSGNWARAASGFWLVATRNLSPGSEI